MRRGGLSVRRDEEEGGPRGLRDVLDGEHFLG